MKKKSRKTLRRLLDKACSLYIKERDRWKCQWCKKDVEGASAHWSHIIPRSHGFRMRWEPRNAICLCPKCHWKWHEDALGRQWFDAEFPEEIKWLLEQKAMGTKKFTNSDLQELLEELA